MPKHDVVRATASTTVVWPGSNWADECREAAALRAELDRIEPLIGAALLTATAFRLRDREALEHALRRLVTATRVVETEPVGAQV